MYIVDVKPTQVQNHYRTIRGMDGPEIRTNERSSLDQEWSVTLAGGAIELERIVHILQLLQYEDLNSNNGCDICLIRKVLEE